MDLIKILAVLGSGSVLVAVIELIRRGRLKEKYSLIWLFAGAVLLIFSSSRDLLKYALRSVTAFPARFFVPAADHTALFRGSLRIV